MAAPRPIVHVPLLAAASASLYAVALAGVTLLQAQHDAAVTAARQPLADAAATATAERTAAEHAIRRATSALASAAGAYQDTAEASGQLDRALAALADQVALVTGAAAQLPTSVALPAAPSRVVVVAPAAPATQGTTGASGA
jgi:hypothetical protein